MRASFLVILCLGAALGEPSGLPGRRLEEDDGLIASGTTAAPAPTLECEDHQHVDNGQCTQNVCTCPGGTEAEGTACTEDGAHHCTSCDADHEHVDATSKQCTQNECTCTGGTKAEGEACTEHDAHHCTACALAEHFLNGATKRCQAYQSCDCIGESCENGYETKQPSNTSDRKCNVYSPECNSATHWESTPPSEYDDRSCDTCDFSYQFIDKQEGKPTKCSVIGTCNYATEYVKAPANNTANIDCDTKDTCAPGKYEIPQHYKENRQCDNCTAGTFSDMDNAALCLGCDQWVDGEGNANPYSYQSEEGMDACIPHEACGAGKYLKDYSSTAAGACQNCTAGRFKSGLGVQITPYNTCKTCNKGTFSKEGAGECENCVPGRYNPSKNQVDCKACALGTYTGRVSPDAPLLEGRTSVHQCYNCPAGKFADSPGIAECSHCAPGRKGDTTLGHDTHELHGKVYVHANHCRDCPKGYFQVADGKPDCKKCGKNFYAPEVEGGNSECLNCLVANPPHTGGSIDSDTYYWTNGVAGAHNCTKAPRDCEAEDWSAAQPKAGVEGTCRREGVEVTCGGGTYVEVRQVVREGWGEDGEFVTCAELTWERDVDCAPEPCPIDCEWLDWGGWETCDARCGDDARQTRTRDTKAVTGFPLKNSAHEGDQCRDLNGNLVPVDVLQETQTRECNQRYAPFDETYPCEQDCDIGDWGNWGSAPGRPTTCSATCSSGGRNLIWRHRTLVDPEWGGEECPDNAEDSKECNLQCCKGYFSATGAWSADADCEACDKGEYAASESSLTCEPCDFGKYQNAPGQDECIVCGKGYQNHLRGSTSVEACIECDFGKYADGEFQEHCHECDEGKYNGNKNSRFADHCQNCGPGHFSNSKSTKECLKCEPGQYNDREPNDPPSTECKECGAGKFNPERASTSELKCRFCTCGKRSVNGSSVCSSCPTGYARGCPDDAEDLLFDDGKPECEGGSWPLLAHGADGAGCKEVGPGEYAEEGACAPEPCPAGTYEEGNGKGACTKCPLGKASNAVGAKLASTCQNCTAGFYGEAHTSTRGSTQCLACGPGTFQPHEMQDEVADCQDCDTGSYTNTSNQIECIPCETGRYRDTPGPATVCQKCVEGTANNNRGSKVASDCKNCDAGFYQPDKDMASCKSCEVGRYTNPLQKGSVDCHNCTSGRFNPTEAKAAVFEDACQRCGPGKYQENPAAENCTDCGKGTALAGYGSNSADDCVACAAGQFSDFEGASQCSLCKKGRHGNVEELERKEEFVHCLKCPPGQFQAFDGATDCGDCDINQYTPPHSENHHHHNCTDCAVIDSKRYYWTANKRGQDHCVPHKLNCKQSAWGAVPAWTNEYSWTDIAEDPELHASDGSSRAQHKALGGPRNHADQPDGWEAGKWSQCTMSCGVGGQKTQTRHPVRQPALGEPDDACNLENPEDCLKAWGGGRACSDEYYTWSRTDPCEEADMTVADCPIDCIVTQWGPWEECTQKCGTGQTFRERLVSVHDEHGGKNCPQTPADQVALGVPAGDWLKEVKPCNAHSCGEHCNVNGDQESDGQCHTYPAACHLEHVHCTIKWLEHHKSNGFDRSDLATCSGAMGLSIEEDNPCWARGDCRSNCNHAGIAHAENDQCGDERCHDQDADEKALSARLKAYHDKCSQGLATKTNSETSTNGMGDTGACTKMWPTIQVTHDRKNMDKLGKFHCKRTGPDSCACQCDRHPSCCSRENYVLSGTNSASMRGNRFIDIATKQDCCNLCTNHPLCTAWEYTSQGVCALRDGAVSAADFTPNELAGEVTTYAGTPVDTPCLSGHTRDADYNSRGDGERPNAFEQLSNFKVDRGNDYSTYRAYADETPSVNPDV